MKKVFILLASFLFMSSVNAEELKNVEIINCESISNIWMKIDGEVSRIKLLAYDEGDGSLNDEINEYTCTVLKSAKNIQVEYDPAITSKDNYNRELLWVYVDDVLLQNMLIEKGYGQVNFITGDYLHTNELCVTQKEALIKKIGIWEYPDIKEEYCQSGVDINQTGKKEELKKEETKVDTKSLSHLIFLNSCIILLLIIYRIKKR